MAQGRGKQPKAAPSRAKCSTCGASLRPTNKFCPNCGAIVAAPSAPSPAVASAPPTSAPAAVRAGPSLQVGSQPQAALEEQRKVVTVMFADLSGSTPLGERLDPEELRGILAGYFRNLAREIQRFGGTVDKYIGDAVMAVFGAPVSHEDDTERAIGAALAMQGAIAEENAALERKYGVRLALRIGVNTGEVVAGLLAGEVQSAYTVVGDTVNTAQRFESAAAINTILASESTYRLARRSFRFEALPPVTLKGKAEPVPAFRVIGRERRAAPREGPPLVGRAGELAHLRSFLAEATAGRGQLVHLHGEAGVGKTRLLNEFLSGLPAEVQRFRARCISYEAATPYALVADFVRRAFRIQPADDEATAEAALAAGLEPLGASLEESASALFLEILGYGERSALSPERKRQLLVSLLRRLLQQRSGLHPLVVVTEDIHWIDPASAALFGEVVGEVPRLRCLFLATSRDDAVVFAGAIPVPLVPLDASTAAEMLDRVALGPLDARVRSLVLERTAGNPFFIEEVVRAIGTKQSATVPATVQDLLEARLDALDASAKQAAQRAAVIGRTFEVHVLGRISPNEPLAPALAILQAEAFIVPRPAAHDRLYAFRHALLQEVAYQTQLLAKRRRLHGAVGDAIADLHADRLDELVDVLAFHYSRSEDDAKARRYLLLAGERAQRLFAKDEAISYFRGALERSADDADARALAHEGLGDVQRLAGLYGDAVASYAEALAARGPGECVARSGLLRKTGAVQQLQGATVAALETLARALADLPPDAERERALVLLEVGQVRWQQGQLDDAIANLKESIAHAEPVGADDARADAYRHLGTVQVLEGNAREGLRYYEQSLQLYEALGDVFGQANALNNIGIVNRKEGRYADALAAHERALAIRERIGDPWGIGLACNNIGQIHRARGALERAEVDYGAALELWRSIGYAHGVPIARTGLGITAVERGQHAAGRALLLTALEEWEKIGNRSYLSELQRYLAQAWLPDDAKAALAWAERSVATARELRAVDDEGIALRVLGSVREALRENEAALAALERSRDILRRTAERQELGRTLAALGRLYRALPDGDARRAQADKLLAEARDIFSELGATLDLRFLEEGASAQ